MRPQYWLAALLGVLSVLLLTHVVAEDLLPKDMNGRWSGTSGRGMNQTPIDWAWSVHIAKQNPDKSLEGTITYEGRRCSAKDAPMTGTFDGVELVIKTQLEPKAQCGASTMRMKKTGGKHLFEGTNRSGADGYLDPA